MKNTNYLSNQQASLNSFQTDIDQYNKENINLNNFESNLKLMNLSQNEESKLSTECSYQSYASLSKNEASFKQFQKVGSNLNGVGLEKKNATFIEAIEKKYINGNLQMKNFKNGGNPLSSLSYKPLNSKSSLVNPPNKFEFQNSQNLNDKNNLLPLYSKYYSDIPHDYLLEIWENLKAEESEINYYDLIIKKQKDVNEKMRAILIDWIVEVHEKCKLKAETLYLVISIIDRFLSKKEILRTHLQLVGVAALMIACKYEEIFVPDIREFVRITDNAFDKKQILQAEVEILLALEYNMTLPSCLRFFEIIALNFNFNNIEFCFGNYLLELFLFDMSMNKFPPSMIALGVAYIIMKTNNYSNYKELYKLLYEMKYIRSQDESESLKELAKLIYSYLDKAKYLKSVFVKYSKEENHQVSVLGMGNLCVRK